MPVRTLMFGPNDPNCVVLIHDNSCGEEITRLVRHFERFGPRTVTQFAEEDFVSLISVANPDNPDIPVLVQGYGRIVVFVILTCDLFDDRHSKGADPAF